MKKIRMILLLLVIALLHVEECKAGRSIGDRISEWLFPEHSSADAYGPSASEIAAEKAAAKKAAEEKKKVEVQLSTATATTAETRGSGVDATRATSGQQYDTSVSGKKGSDDDAAANALRAFHDEGDIEFSSVSIQSGRAKVSRLKAIANSIRNISLKSFLNRFRSTEEELGLKPQSAGFLRKQLQRIKNRASQLADKVAEWGEYLKDIKDGVVARYYSGQDIIVIRGHNQVTMTATEFAVAESVEDFGSLEVTMADPAEQLAAAAKAKQEWMDKGLTSEDAQRLIDLEAKQISGASKGEVDSVTGGAKKALTVEEEQDLKGLYDKVIAAGKERKAAEKESLIKRGLTPDEAERYMDLKSDGFNFLTTDDREFIQRLNLGGSESQA